MAFRFSVVVALLLLSLVNSVQAATTANQSQFFTLMKNSVKGNLLSYWNNTNGLSPFCSYKGIGCDENGDVASIDLSHQSLSGHFPDDVCSYLPQLRILNLGQNNLQGGFPSSITNCSRLEQLNMSALYMTGKLPDFSPLTSLRLLDLSINSFTGDFPLSVTNLTNIEVLNFNENPGFNVWELPENISGLKKLNTMVLQTCTIRGLIPRSLGNMTSLMDLELGGNFLVGRIPMELGLLKNLKKLELYYNQQLEGEIPEELGNLTELIDLDMSVNKLSGKIPESIWRLPKLQVLQLYNNTLIGEIPEAIENSTTLTTLSLYDNFLTGEVPKGLGRSSPLVIFELSENRLSGELPAETCNGGKLQYFLVLGNSFSGRIPENYGKCESLLRFRVSNNRLEGIIPEGLFALPCVSILDLGYNNLNGSVPNSIGNAKNLSQILIQSNAISGVLPPEISHAVSLVKIDLSNNLLSGPIPSEIGNLRNLNSLMLQGNKFNSSIPDSLSSLKSLNVLELSNNHLMGSIPESLCELLPNSMNFSENLLSGPIPPLFIKGGLLESFSGNPGLCVSDHLSSSHDSHIYFPTCSQSLNHKKINVVWVITISVAIMSVGMILYMKRRLCKEDSMMELNETSSSAFSEYDVKSFHRISFDRREITESLIEKNIVGQGGSGTVYKIQLGNGEVVAVKKLWSRSTKDFASEDRLDMDKGLKTEVETLGSIRHKNIVKLYSYFSRLDCSLLVYEYMPNGNLWDALHNGRILLHWPTRHQIALGVAQGLAYLHHDLKQPIIHRDIKSTNILLDIDYKAKVADFGIAKVLQARGGKDSSTTVIAGTYGYMAPEYAYSSKATTKCDVYSFGVVLMELLTGRKPVEAEFGEGRNIIYWVSTKVETKEGATGVLDKQVSEAFIDEMINVLKIAIRCTYKAPSHRPTMSEVVQLLIEADPYGCDICKSSNKTKDSANVTKTQSN